MSAISVQGVEQLFHMGKRNVVHALRGTDLEVGDGEFLAVMGPSGSGKSTLLNVIGCLARPTAGHVVLDGRDVTKLKDGDLDEIRAREVGFVFQGYSLIPTRTALENVMLAAEYAGVPRAERKTRSLEILEKVGLADRVDAARRPSSPAASSSGWLSPERSSSARSSCSPTSPPATSTRSPPRRSWGSSRGCAPTARRWSWSRTTPRWPATPTGSCS